MAITEELELKVLTGVISEETVEPKETDNAVQKLHRVKPKDKIKLHDEGVITYNVQNYQELNKSRPLVVANVFKDYTELDEQIMSMMLKREGTWSCKVSGKNR